MATTIYTYTSPADFTGLTQAKPDLGALEQEITSADPGGAQPAVSYVSSVYQEGPVVSVRMTDELESGNKTALDGLIAAHTGVPLAKTPLPVSTGQPATVDNVLRVSVEHAEGSRSSLISPNWCDRLSWFYNSVKKTGKALTENSATVFQDPDGKHWIDNYHGRYSGEDTAATKDGDIPRLKVYVDAVLKTEQDPHFGSGGDYTVEYGASGGAKVTFAASQAGKAVTVDCWEVNGSSWTLRPAAGKKLKIAAVEAQFSEDASLLDSVIFQAKGLVDVFAPQLMPGVPSGTKIPLGNPVVYKTMVDFINEANGSLPTIPKTTAVTPSWRDLTQNIITYPWNYQAVTELKSSLGLEIEIKLQHDMPFSGLVATATFYCLSYVE